MTTHVVEFLVNLWHLTFVDIPKAWLPTDVTLSKTLYPCLCYFNSFLGSSHFPPVPNSFLAAINVASLMFLKIITCHVVFFLYTFLLTRGNCILFLKLYKPTATVLGTHWASSLKPQFVIRGNSYTTWWYIKVLYLHDRPLIFIMNTQSSNCVCISFMFPLYASVASASFTT